MTRVTKIHGQGGRRRRDKIRRREKRSVETFVLRSRLGSTTFAAIFLLHVSALRSLAEKNARRFGETEGSWFPGKRKLIITVSTKRKGIIPVREAVQVSRTIKLE